MQWQRGQFTVDSDRDRLDRDAIGHWIGNAYWASDRPPEAIRRSWDASFAVFGLYDGDRQIGCARVVSDGVAIAYLADVFIEPAHRGQGLGLWMVQSILSFPPLGTAKWSLHTRDAHALYQQLGFGPPSPRVMERAAVSE